MSNTSFQHLSNVSLHIETLLKSELVSGNSSSQKELNDFSAREVAELVGVNHTRIHQLEQEGRLPSPRTIMKGSVKARVYNLVEIEHIRKFLRLMPPRIVDHRAAILTFGNLKGGVGKSTNSVHTAQYFALQGYKVLFVDLDPQATATSSFGYIPLQDITLEDTIFNAIVTSPDMISDVVRSTYWNNIDLIPSSLELHAADAMVYRSNNGIAPALRVKAALDEVKDQYDIIVIDTPPSVNMLAIGASITADHLVIPVVANRPDVQATSQYFKTMSDMLNTIAGDEFADTNLSKSILVSRFDVSSGEQRNNLALLRRFYNGTVMEAVVYDTIEMERAANDMQTVYENKPRGSRETYKKAIDMLNRANQEILNNLIKSARSKADQE
jgi:chromosome partitioning protein